MKRRDSGKDEGKRIFLILGCFWIPSLQLLLAQFILVVLRHKKALEVRS